MWLCIILDGDRNVYNDDASKRYLGSYSDIGFFAVVKKKNKEAVLCFFLKRKNNDIKNGSEFTDPLFPCHCFR